MFPRKARSTTRRGPIAREDAFAVERLRAAGVREVPDSLKCRYTSSCGSLSPTGDSRLYSNLDSKLAPS